MSYQIYIFQNKINSKIYVGQTTNFDSRVKKHIRNAFKDNKNSHFYSALRADGIDNFNYFVIDELASKEELDDAEMFWIQYFRSWDRSFGYNLTLGGDGNIPTTETREKMRLAKLGKPNPNMQGDKHPFYGLTGKQHHRYGISHTDEAKKKISEANIGRDFPKGSQQSNSRIIEEDVLFMREYFTNNPQIKTSDIFTLLANQFNIEEGTVESIIYNYSWKHVKMFPIVNKNIKIKDDDVIFIRQEMSIATKKVARRKELAAQFNVSTHSIYEIETRRKRKDIQ